MPFYRWDDMKKRNIVSTTDSRGSMVLGAFTTLTRQEQPPGKATRPHSHGCEQIIHILEGAGWFRVGDEEKTLSAGEVVHIPLGVEHELKNPGDEVLVYLSFKNRSEDWPPREALTSDAAGEQPAAPGLLKKTSFRDSGHGTER